MRKEIIIIDCSLIDQLNDLLYINLHAILLHIFINKYSTRVYLIELWVQGSPFTDKFRTTFYYCDKRENPCPDIF